MSADALYVTREGSLMMNGTDDARPTVLVGEHLCPVRSVDRNGKATGHIDRFGRHDIDVIDEICAKFSLGVNGRVQFPPQKRHP
jgi:hypothetical protein